MSASESVKQVHPAVKAFVLFHLFVIMCWSIPAPSPEARDRKAEGVKVGGLPGLQEELLFVNDEFVRSRNLPFSYYANGTGTWQYWDMFAPNPLNVDRWHDFEITFADGSTEILPYPRIKLMPIPEKYVKERYRKYTERLFNDDYRHKWPYTAYWAARKALKDPANPPVTVNFRTHEIAIPKMGLPVPKEYATYSIYTAAIDPERLNAEVKK